MVFSYSKARGGFLCESGDEMNLITTFIVNFEILSSSTLILKLIIIFMMNLFHDFHKFFAASSIVDYQQLSQLVRSRKHF